MWKKVQIKPKRMLTDAINQRNATQPPIKKKTKQRNDSAQIDKEQIYR